MRRVLPFVVLFVTAAPARADHTFNLGVRTTAQHLASAAEGEEDQGIKLAGGGLQARWRFARSWGLELSGDLLRGQLAGGDFVRQSGALTASILWHPFGPVEWDFYVLAGIGGTTDTVTLRDRDDRELEQVFQETHVHFGVGLEHLWTHWGLGVELRAVGLVREDEEEAREGEAVPPQSGGVQGSVTFGYYF